MSKGSKGKMARRTRNLGRHKKKLTVSDMMKKFEEGDKVLVKIKPNYNTSLPHPKFNGRHGKVLGVKGMAYVIQIKCGKALKSLDILPVHLEQSS